jgi:bisphosphoglycerate-independent phosphoglycerate mutase (AlkP superfamily)
MRTPWDTVRHDSVTLGLALGYVEAYRPALFYLSLGEMDDWAHERRYDRTVQSIHDFDRALRELWTYLQSTEPYRGRTTLVVTTDHGRGRGDQDWTSHGEDVPGSDEIWIGIFGPDTPRRGEVRSVENVYQSNVAATILTLLGLDYREFNPDADGPIPEALPSR